MDGVAEAWTPVDIVSDSYRRSSNDYRSDNMNFEPVQRQLKFNVSVVDAHSDDLMTGSTKFKSSEVESSSHENRLSFDSQEGSSASSHPPRYGSEAFSYRGQLAVPTSRRGSQVARTSWRKSTRKSTFKVRAAKWRLLTWMQSFKVNYEELTTGEVVGDGSTATVFKGIFHEEEVAIKQFFPGKEEDEKNYKALVRELEVLTSLQHENLVKLIGVVEAPPCIVMELCSGGNLFQLLYKSAYKIQWHQQLKIATDIADAMDYLHALEPQIIHRDLKSLNCLLDEPVVSKDCEPFVKVADFGMARRWDPFRKLTRGCGTCHWMAPEVVQGTDYEAKADVFSYGMVLWEVLIQQVPFQELSPTSASESMVKGLRPEVEGVQFPEQCPEDLISLMTRCWSQDPSSRPEFEEVLECLEDIHCDLSDEKEEDEKTEDGKQTDDEDNN